MHVGHWLVSIGALLGSTSVVYGQTEPAGAPVTISQPPAVTAAPPTPAAVPLPYGRRGQWILGGTSHMTIGGGHFAKRSIGSVLPENEFELSVSPSAAVFVAPHVAIGLSGAAQVMRAPGVTAWSLTIGPEVRGFIPFSPRVGLLPGLGLLYRRINADDTLIVQVKIPVAIHLNQHLSLVAGPQVRQDAWRHRAKLRATGYVAFVGIIGWL